jgi:hypothetical protein
MSNNYGGGVSRVLDPTGTEFVEVIWQEGKPPLDAEVNLLQELSMNFTRRTVLRGAPSGWLGNETNPLMDYTTNPSWSNWLKFGKQRSGELQSFMWAAVNGWIIPVGGTKTGTPPGSPNDTDTTNWITLDPPPSNAGDFRIDFVFLEVWLARIPPNPATTNKPAASSIYRYGNVEGGFSYIADDLQDIDIGFETTQRVQVQYRVRVAKGLVGFASYPDGFDPVVVKAQGAATAVTSFTFQNMKNTLGDPGLWRAGDGLTNSLGTVDGYVYAIPIAAVFRRNSVNWAGDPSQNLNGGFNRNPTAIDRTGYKTFSTTATLASNLGDGAGDLVATLVTAANTGLPLTPSTPVYVQIGDEILTYSVISGATMTLVARGAAGSRREKHVAGTTVKILSGRPDGLFSDQVALTDILDLRHVVNPNGFDHKTLLESNFMKLMRGQLRSNWKRSGAGPQGPFVSYQDKITTGAAALGVTKLDGPDNIRQIFSDAMVTQKVYGVVKANSAALPSSIGVAWSLSLQSNHTTRTTPNNFSPNDVIVFPVSQLKAGLPGGDADQARWVYDNTTASVEIRMDGETQAIPPSSYTVTPTNPTSSSDLTITLGADFPVTTKQLYITLHLQYGSGRGISRKSDSLHSVAYTSASSDLLLQQVQAAPSSDAPTRVSPMLMWSKYKDAMLGKYLPSMAEVLFDPGAKTVVLNPLRRIDMPDEFITIDGSTVNTRPSSFASNTTGQFFTAGTIFEELAANFTTNGTIVGDSLYVSNGPQPGRYTITQIAPGGNVNRVVLERPIPNTTATLNWYLYHGQGLMPLLKADGVTPKWTTTDPLELFSGTTDPAATTKNLYVQMPRYMVPGWGEYKLPLLHTDAPTFSEGINYMFITKKGVGPYPTTETNYIPYSNGSLSYAAFSTVNLQDPTPLTNATVYNTKYTVPITYAGVRKFTDTRGLGRKGLELPPFYGVARLWAVYEANDYKTNGSAYDPSTRNASGSLTAAKNLLRQNFNGPLFWVELDDDDDSTFILNADALDLSKSTNYPIVSFDNANTHFVIEANIFGFDRGAFNVNNECRIVLTRVGSTGFMRSEANDGVLRSNNVNIDITGPVAVLNGPPTGADQVVVNFSRTPYQGDAWGSQTNYQDIGYTQGPLLSSTAYQLASTSLDTNALTRPNQKSLEVLASINFITTLGTGRLSGDDVSGGIFLPESVGYEDLTAWPPTSPVAPRPNLKLGALDSNGGYALGNEFIGCTERLPLGALWRDKDFKGQRFSSSHQLPLVFLHDKASGFFLSYANKTNLEQEEIVGVEAATSGSGFPGDFLVHVDGEQGNYALLTNFRTNRGGSTFMASGPRPGGEVVSILETIAAISAAPRVNVLTGTAYLVRNTVTNVGATEVSAGDELMMLIVTSAEKLSASNQPAVMMISTNGTNEGYAAADLFRLEGRPLVSDNFKTEIEPSTITLTERLYRVA